MSRSCVRDTAEHRCVSVIIPTYNRVGLLPRVLAPVLTDPATLEVLVIVDGSPDKSFEALTAMARRQERLRPVLAPNHGEGAGRHEGVRRARGYVVLFLDDDVEAEPGLVGSHARHHSFGEQVLVIGYAPLHGDPANRRGDFSAQVYSEAYERRCAEYERDPGAILLHLWAGNFSMRREDAARVGLHNPAYTERYHTDLEFGLRCLKAGLTARFDRSLLAHHHYTRSLRAFEQDALSRGAGHKLIGSLHPGLVGPLHPDWTRELPPPAERIVRFARRPRLHHAVRLALSASVRLLGWMHAYRSQVTAARLLRRVLQQRGVA